MIFLRGRILQVEPVWFAPDLYTDNRNINIFS